VIVVKRASVAFSRSGVVVAIASARACEEREREEQERRERERAKREKRERERGGVWCETPLLLLKLSRWARTAEGRNGQQPEAARG
jgi:hypothetical protein